MSQFMIHRLKDRYSRDECRGRMSGVLELSSAGEMLTRECHECHYKDQVQLRPLSELDLPMSHEEIADRIAELSDQ